MLLALGQLGKGVVHRVLRPRSLLRRLLGRLLALSVGRQRHLDIDPVLQQLGLDRVHPHHPTLQDVIFLTLARFTQLLACRLIRREERLGNELGRPLRRRLVRIRPARQRPRGLGADVAVTVDQHRQFHPVLCLLDPAFQRLTRDDPLGNRHLLGIELFLLPCRLENLLILARIVRRQPLFGHGEYLVPLAHPRHAALLAHLIDRSHRRIRRERQMPPAIELPVAHRRLQPVLARRRERHIHAAPHLVQDVLHRLRPQAELPCHLRIRRALGHRLEHMPVDRRHLLQRDIHRLDLRGRGGTQSAVIIRRIDGEHATKYGSHGSSVTSSATSAGPYHADSRATCPAAMSSSPARTRHQHRPKFSENKCTVGAQPFFSARKREPSQVP